MIGNNSRSCLCIYVGSWGGGEPYTLNDINDEMSAEWFFFVVGMVLFSESLIEL